MWQLSAAIFFHLIQEAITRPWSDLISQACLLKTDSHCIKGSTASQNDRIVFQRRRIIMLRTMCGAPGGEWNLNIKTKRNDQTLPAAFVITTFVLWTCSQQHVCSRLGVTHPTYPGGHRDARLSLSPWKYSPAWRRWPHRPATALWKHNGSEGQKWGKQTWATSAWKCNFLMTT